MARVKVEVLLTRDTKFRELLLENPDGLPFQRLREEMPGELTDRQLRGVIHRNRMRRNVTLVRDGTRHPLWRWVGADAG